MLDDWPKQMSDTAISPYTSMFFKIDQNMIIFTELYVLTALYLQRTGLGIQREAAEVHVAHGGDSNSAGRTAVTPRKK